MISAASTYVILIISDQAASFHAILQDPVSCLIHTIDQRNRMDETSKICTSDTMVWTTPIFAQKALPDSWDTRPNQLTQPDYLFPQLQL